MCVHVWANIGSTGKRPAIAGGGADRKIVARDKRQAVYRLLKRFGQPLNRVGLTGTPYLGLALRADRAQVSAIPFPASL